jgi:hypothetical protein
VSGLFDPAQWLVDTQAAMRALWPDRPMVYLQDKPGQDPAVPVLTDDERGQLTRVADAIKAARELPVDTVAPGGAARLVEMRLRALVTDWPAGDVPVVTLEQLTEILEGRA